MDSLALVIPVLGCAVMMAVMMWFMQRGRGAPSTHRAEAGGNSRSGDPAGG